MKFRLRCPWGRLCWATQPCAAHFHTVSGFFHVSMASRVAAAKAMWPAELKTFTVWPLAERLADPRVRLGNHIHILLTSVPILPPPGPRGDLEGDEARDAWVSHAQARLRLRVPGSARRTCPGRSRTAAPCDRGREPEEARLVPRRVLFVSVLHVHVGIATGQEGSHGFNILDPNNSYREEGRSYVIQIGRLHRAV